VVALGIVQGVAVQVEPADGRVAEALASRSTGGYLDVGPELAEIRADGIQPIDEGADGGVVWRAGACRAQVGDRLACELIGPGGVVAGAGGGLRRERG
jgi:hypothetical protein